MSSRFTAAAAQFVHRKQRLAYQSVERVVGLVPFRVRQNRPDDLLINTALAQDFRPLLRVVGDARPAFVIKVVQQAGDAPLPGVLAQLGRVMPHRRLDRERVFQQRLRLRIFVEQPPRFVTIHARSVGRSREERKPRLARRPR